MMYRDFSARVTKVGPDCAEILFSDGSRQWIDKMDMSYASWYIASRSPVGTILELKIRAYVVRTKYPGVAA
jgi:hypothetical protein